MDGLKHYGDVKIVEERSLTGRDGSVHTWTSESISLEKLTDKRIKDVEVSVTTGFGDPILSFHTILFEDGSRLSLEGAHDLVYCDGVTGSFTTLGAKQMAVLYNESNGFERLYEDGEENDEYLDPEMYDE